MLGRKRPRHRDPEPATTTLSGRSDSARYAGRFARSDAIRILLYKCSISTMASQSRKNRYAKIHSAISELGWEEQDYRNALWGMFQVSSKTDLSLKQLDQFIQMLRKRMVERGLLEPTEVKWGWGKEKYGSLRGRSGDYAAPQQLRLVEASWREVARNQGDEALQEFISGLVDIDHIIWLKKEDVSTVLVALKNMYEQEGMEPPFEVDDEGDESPDQTASEDSSNGDHGPFEAGGNTSPGRVDLTEMTQKERVLWYLRNHGELTPKAAENELGIGRLAARIYDLRQEGYPIETDKRQVENQFGTSTVAFYSLNTNE
jgi:hypothetical protein